MVHDDMATAARSGVAPRAAAPPLIPVATQRRRAKWPPSFPFLEQDRPAKRQRPPSKGPDLLHDPDRSAKVTRDPDQSLSTPRATRPEPAQRTRAPRLPGREPREAQRIRRRALDVGARSRSSPARPAPISWDGRGGLYTDHTVAAHLIACNWPGSSDQRTGRRNSLDRIRSCSGTPPSVWRLSARSPRTARVRPDRHLGKLLEHLFDFSAKLP